MSTTLLIGRTPARSRRCCSHGGDGATRSPSKAVMLNRPPCSILARSSGAASSAAAGGRAGTAAKLVRPPIRAATSRAIPCIERPSGRLAVIASSSTWSSRPSRVPTGLPRGGSTTPSSSRMAIPSPPLSPSSWREQIMPLLATPRSSAGLIVSPTAGRVAPTRATGTWIPARTLGAPQTICSGSAAPTATLQTLSLSAAGWGSRRSTRPTTTPAARAARSSIASTSKPAIESRSASPSAARASSSPSTSSRSHWSETLIRPPPSQRRILGIGRLPRPRCGCDGG